MFAKRAPLLSGVLLLFVGVAAALEPGNTARCADETMDISEEAMSERLQRERELVMAKWEVSMASRFDAETGEILDEGEQAIVPDHVASDDVSSVSGDKCPEFAEPVYYCNMTDGQFPAGTYTWDFMPCENGCYRGHWDTM